MFGELQVVVDFPSGPTSYRAATGEVPCRFEVGDKVITCGEGTGPIETVEKIEWVWTVWHSIEPYWRVETDLSGGPQAGYVKAERR